MWLSPAVCCRDITMYLVLSAFTSSPISLVATTRASAFSFTWKASYYSIFKIATSTTVTVRLCPSKLSSSTQTHCLMSLRLWLLYLPVVQYVLPKYLYSLSDTNKRIGVKITHRHTFRMSAVRIPVIEKCEHLHYFVSVSRLGFCVSFPNFSQFTSVQFGRWCYSTV